MKKAYVFDFDGTLVDSMPYWSEKMLNILRATKTPIPSDVIKIITPLGDKGTAKYFRETLGVKLSDEEMYELMDEYALPKYRDEIPLKDGVKEYLIKSKEKGISLNVLTASPHKMLDPCLKRLGVYDLFDYVFSCDDFNMVKSNPEIYLKTCERIGVSVSNTVFFDDNLLACKTAKEAGLKVVGVYDKTGKDFAKELKKLCDDYVNDFESCEQF
jgi:HAD superfamily hydrolase (TIGR01509 family)